MAVITRRTWANLLTEATRRLKGIDYVGFDARVQQWLADASLFLSTTYHHFELDMRATGTLSTASNEITLPADCFIASIVERKAVGGTPSGSLRLKDYHSYLSTYAAASGKPTTFTRFGSKLLLDVIPDAAYPYELFYYRLPTAPDFSGSATSELGWDTDAALLDVTLALATSNLSMLDSIDIHRQLFSDWLAAQVRPPLNASDQPDRPLSPRTNQSHGGQQG